MGGLYPGLKCVTIKSNTKVDKIPSYAAVDLMNLNFKMEIVYQLL